MEVIFETRLNPRTKYTSLSVLWQISLKEPFSSPEGTSIGKFDNSWQFFTSICPQPSNWLNLFFNSIVYLVDRIAHCACFLSHCAVLLCILLSYFYDWNGWHWAKLCIASTGHAHGICNVVHLRSTDHVICNTTTTSPFCSLWVRIALLQFVKT